MQLRERSVADLTNILEKQAVFQQSLTEKEVAFRQKYLEEVDTETRTRRAQLDELHLTRETALAAKEREREEDAKRREDEFKKRVEQFETREAKHMRRDLLKRIEQVLETAKDFKVSPDTERKRDQVRIGVVVIAIVTMLIGWTMVKRIAGGETAWQPFAALSAASVTLLSTLVYYLKWSDRWFREHADAEFAARRYRADILRASWVAELVSEWQT